MQIGELARRAGLATSAIRFYEERGLIPEPGRTSSGYRDFDADVVGRLQFIRAGQALGLTLRELSDVLEIRDRGETPCRHVTELIDEKISEVDRRIRDLRALRGDLAGIKDDAERLDPAECPPESVCKILSTSGSPH